MKLSTVIYELRWKTKEAGWKKMFWTKLEKTTWPQETTLIKTNKGYVSAFPCVSNSSRSWDLLTDCMSNQSKKLEPWLYSWCIPKKIKSTKKMSPKSFNHGLTNLFYPKLSQLKIKFKIKIKILIKLLKLTC